MNKKIIIFDMDGVIFDTIPYAREVFMKRHPGVTEEMYNEIHSGNFHEGAEKYKHLKTQFTEEEENEHKRQYAEVKMKTPMFGGIKELLGNLNNKGYRLVLNTNGYQQNVFPLLKYSNIETLFDFIATAEVSKSKIEKFEIIEKKYNVGKKDLLFITDALGDVKEAEIAQVPTIAVTWGVHDSTYFDKEKYTNLIGIVDTVEELSNLITK